MRAHTLHLFKEAGLLIGEDKSYFFQHLVLHRDHTMQMITF